MFTSKTQSKKGMISTALGSMAVFSVCLSVFLAYKVGEAVVVRLGTTLLFTFLFAIVGETIGIQAHLEKDKLYFFPRLGILLNGLSILSILAMILIGVMN